MFLVEPIVILSSRVLFTYGVRGHVTVSPGLWLFMLSVQSSMSLCCMFVVALPFGGAGSALGAVSAAFILHLACDAVLVA